MYEAISRLAQPSMGGEEPYIPWERFSPGGLNLQQPQNYPTGRHSPFTARPEFNTGSERDQGGFCDMKRLELTAIRAGALHERKVTAQDSIQVE
jgi:hypothetical protein